VGTFVSITSRTLTVQALERQEHVEQRLHRLGLGYAAYDLASLDDVKPPDVLLGHNLQCPPYRLVWTDGDDRRGHDLLDPHVEAVALRDAPPQDVPLCHDAHWEAFLRDEEGPDVLLDHPLDGLHHGGLGIDRGDVRLHHIPDPDGDGHLPRQ
jgi:hypothetical protein